MPGHFFRSIDRRPRHSKVDRHVEQTRHICCRHRYYRLKIFAIGKLLQTTDRLIR